VCSFFAKINSNRRHRANNIFKSFRQLASCSTIEFIDVDVFQFDTALSLSNQLDIEEEIFFLKTSHGRLRGEAKVVKNNEAICVSILTNQTLYGCGIKNKGTHAFCLLDEDYEPSEGSTSNFSNDLSNIATKIISGFSNKANFRSFHLPANSRVLMYICKTPTIKTIIQKTSKNLDISTSKINTIQPEPGCHQRVQMAYKAILDGEHKSGLNRGLTPNKHKAVLHALADCFAQKHHSEAIAIKLTQRHELCKDLTMWGYTHVNQDHSLERVLAEIHTTRASISQGCKETLGIGPMEVLRYIRLEHVYEALKNPEVRQQIGCHKVEDTREYYGFKSRGNFSALYKNYLDETPRATIKSCKRQTNIETNE